MEERRFKIFALRLLIAILGRLMFPNMLSVERDREHQLLSSKASNFEEYLSNKEKENAQP